MAVRLFATPKQIEFINSTKRYLGVFAGRRYGKTKGIWMPRATAKLLRTPHFNYMYIAPGYALAKEMYELMVDKLHPYIKRKVGQPKPQITFWNNSVIDFRSFDKPHFIRGGGRNEVAFDEIQDCKSEDLFWSIIRPLISDEFGSLMVLGQFRGHNWYYRFFYERGQKPEEFPQHASCALPTWEGIKFQSEQGRAEIEDLRASLPKAIFEQEIACVPAANQCAVFLQDDLSKIKRGEALLRPKDGARYIIGYDLGEVVDPSAMVIMDFDTCAVVHAEVMPLRMKHQEQAKRLADEARRWNAQVIIDGTSGGTGGHRTADENVKYYRQNIPDLRVVVWSGGIKREMVRIVTQYIEQHKISIPAQLIKLHEELEAYEWEAKPEGLYDYHGPEGKNDNLVAALMMACAAHRNGWVRPKGGLSIGQLMY